MLKWNETQMEANAILHPAKHIHDDVYSLEIIKQEFIWLED